MPEVLAQCPLCGGSNSSLFDKRSFKGIGIENRLCTDCGLVYQSPRMTEAEANEFYKQEYRKLYQNSEKPTTQDLSVQKGRAGFMTQFLREHTDGGFQRFFEVGASNGILLEKIKEEFSAEVAGAEPSEAYRAEATEKGLSIYASVEEAFADQEKNQAKPYDVLAMSHVLEHINHPVPFLSLLREKLLAPDGYLFLEVPNLYAHESFEVGHVVNYTPHMLHETLRQAGFMPVAQALHGQPRVANIPLYITVLAQVNQAASALAIRPENMVAQKRRWGMFWARVVKKFFRKPGILG